MNNCKKTYWYNLVKKNRKSGEVGTAYFRFYREEIKLSL